MAMTSCRECKKEVSGKASVCPHCGIREPGGLGDYIFGYICGVVLGLYIIYSLIF